MCEIQLVPVNMWKIKEIELRVSNSPLKISHVRDLYVFFPFSRHYKPLLL